MLKLLAFDRFTLLLFVMVLLASFAPISGQAASVFSVLTTVAIAILFFLHGAKLSREAVIQGMMHWKLHALVFAFTFILFPTTILKCSPLVSICSLHKVTCRCCATFTLTPLQSLSKKPMRWALSTRRWGRWCARLTMLMPKPTGRIRLRSYLRTARLG